MDELSFFSFVNDRYNVPRGTFEKLKIYSELLLKWQKAINLVSRGTLDGFWKRHVLDSLQLVEHMRGRKILDIGSGGGFPGMVLGLCGDFDVTCVDSDSRKMVFLEEVARKTSANVSLITKRIEYYEECDFDTVVSRGFASLDILVSLTKKHSQEKYGVFLKGANVSEEISEAQKSCEFHFETFDSATDKGGKIVVIKIPEHQKYE